MDYDKRFDWKAVNEEHGLDKHGVPDDMHRVKVKEFETGNEKTKWFNFQLPQTKDDTWKRHVDQWIEKLKKPIEKNSVLDKS